MLVSCLRPRSATASVSACSPLLTMFLHAPDQSHKLSSLTRCILYRYQQHQQFIQPLCQQVAQLLYDRSLVPKDHQGARKRVESRAIGCHGEAGICEHSGVEGQSRIGPDALASRNLRRVLVLAQGNEDMSYKWGSGTLAGLRACS